MYRYVLTAILILSTGCLDTSSKSNVEEVTQALTSSIDIKKAITASMPELLESDERMRMDPDLASALGVVVGNQVRITRTSSEYALYTVSGFYEDGSDNDDGRMAKAARQRLGTDNAFDDATVDTEVMSDSLVNPSAQDLADAESTANSNSEFIEFLYDDGSHSDLVILAPHGGHMEPETDDQAKVMHNALSSYGVTFWACEGFKSGGGAHDRWHITSTEIHPDSFPALDQIDTRGFTYAVSFHGMSGTTEVLIGGNGPVTLKQDIQTALEAVLPGNYDVNIATAQDSNSGMSPSNFVNWMTTDGMGGIQIEQTLDVRQNYGDDVATAIAGVFDSLLDSGSSDAGMADCGL